MDTPLRLFCSKLVPNICRVLCAVILGLVIWIEDVAAMTYYISPTGDNANAGTDVAPWKTFAYAMTNTSCGDTLVLKDGAYTTAVHGSLNITKSCTAGNPFTVQAQNQRAARLQGDGSVEVLTISASAYVTVDGLRVTSADNSAPAGNPVNILVNNQSSNITLRNLLVSHNNRYKNTGLIRFADTTNSLVEDTEIYYYHRHGVMFSTGATNNVIRRLYCNSRGYSDIAGGYVSGSSNNGDSCAGNYPGGNNIIENSISEGQSAGFDLEALLGGANIKWYGNISLNDNYGFLFRARGTGSAYQPQNTMVRDGVVITPSSVAMYLRGNLNTHCDNCTFYDSATNSGFVADSEPAYPGGGTYSVFGANVLTTLNALSGIVLAGQTSWTFTNINSYANKANFSPASTNTNYANPTTVDPQLGTCRVWIPDNSPMKRAGKDGADIGANILYRYQNGVLTTMPLWNPTTGEFPHGAIVAGFNDVPGQSLFDVHRRLNVNTNGCYFPASYAQGRDTTPPREPQNVTLR